MILRTTDGRPYSFAVRLRWFCGHNTLCPYDDPSVSLSAATSPFRGGILIHTLVNSAEISNKMHLYYR